MQEQQNHIALGVASLERRMGIVEGRLEMPVGDNRDSSARLTLPSEDNAVAATPLIFTQQDLNAMKLISSHTRAVVPIVRWFCFTTVLSFVNEIPSCRCWIFDSTRERFNSLSSLLPGVSGLALVFFSVRNDEKKKEGYNRSDGAVWTHILKWIFANMITSARTDLYGDAPHLEPLWLASMGNASNTLGIVQKRLKKFRSFADVDDEDTILPSPPSKKRKKTEEVASLPYAGMDVEQRLLARVKTSVLRF